MTTEQLSACLVGVLNSPTRPPALWPLARIKYPGRECQVTQHSDNTWSVALALYGWEYKHRGPRYKSPPPLDLMEIQRVFDAALPDGYTVTAVENHGTHITIYIGGTLL